jgi:copper chaperone CopZ
MTTTTYRVSGMTCEHCVRAVTEEIGDLEGVASVAVDLVPEGVSTVTVEGDPGEPAVAAAVDEAGYELA